MARVPLISPQAGATTTADAALAPLVARIEGRRRGHLINIYRALLHSPPLAETWFDHLNAVRWSTSLSGRLREIVIIRIALLNDCAYAIRQHVPKLAAAEGLTQAECDALADWRHSPLFSPEERAALAYADAMTREIVVADDIAAEAARHFAPARLVELTVLIGTYNMHTRVVRALDIDLEPD